MLEKKEIYADGVSKIYFAGGMVRIDLMTLYPDPNGKKEPEQVVKERIVMSPDGFLRTYNAMQGLITQLSEAGVIKRGQKESDEG